MVKTSIAVIANAKQEIDLWLYHMIKSYTYVMCLDGIFTPLYKVGIKPSALLGDFDSITQDSLQLAQDLLIDIISSPDQNASDLAKGIEYCITHYKKSHIHVYNGLGGDRLDHTLVNISYLKKFYSKNRKIILIEEKQKTEFYKDTILKISGPINSNIAIMPLYKAIVSTSGLLYDMNQMELEIGVFSSSSNGLLNPEAIIEIQGECLIIYDHKQNITHLS